MLNIPDAMLVRCSETSGCFNVTTHVYRLLCVPNRTLATVKVERVSFDETPELIAWPLSSIHANVNGGVPDDVLQANVASWPSFTVSMEGETFATGGSGQACTTKFMDQNRCQIKFN